MGNVDPKLLKAWTAAWWNQIDKAEATKIWADVVAHDRERAVADLMNVENLDKHTALKVASFPSPAPSTAVSVFKVEVLPSLSAAPTELGVKNGVFTATVYLQYSWPLPKNKTAYDDATKGRPDWSPEMKQRMMAVQLFHELIHARLILERQKEWPAKNKTMYSEFEKWISYVSAPQAAAKVASFKAQLQELIGLTSAGQRVDDAFEHLLQEKFAIQKAFAAFGVQASNAEIALNYVEKKYSGLKVAESVRNLRNMKASAAAAKLVDLYDELDKFNASVKKAPAAPLVPTAPIPTPTTAPRKGTELLKQNWKSAFASVSPANPAKAPFAPYGAGRQMLNPIPRPLPVPVVPVMNTFRPQPPRLTQWQPPVPRPSPINTYSAARPYSSPPVNRFSPPPIARPYANPGMDPYRGPIRSAVSAPPWASSRPERFTPGTGSGWNPDRYSFGGGRIDPSSVTRMNLLSARPQSLYERPMPGWSGSRTNFPAGWDLGSRDR